MTALTETAERDGLPKPRRYWAMAAVCAGTALAVIDGAIANVALPTISRELKVSSEDAVLVVTVYQLILVMTLFPFSALGDKLGHRRLYQWGQILFGVASLLCALSTNLPLLLTARVLQALGASAALSVSSALVRSIYPHSQLGRGMALNTIVIASSTAVAPVIGGAILAIAPWQWVFAVTIPFAVLSLLIGRSSLPRPQQFSTAFDTKAAILSAAMFGLVIVGIEGLAHGQAAWLSVVEIILGILAAVYLVRDQAKVERPIMPFDLLKTRILALTVLAAFLAFVAQMSLLVSLPFRLQHHYGFSAAEVGATISPWALAMMVMAPSAGILSDKIPASILGGIGMTIATIGLGLMAWLPANADFVDIAWRMAICGTGFAWFLSPNARLIIGSAPRDRAAAMGSVVSTARLTGQTLGASLTAGLLALGIGDGMVPAIIAMALTLCCLLLSVARLDRHNLRSRKEKSAPEDRSWAEP